jgi:branched-chain amino acid transport system permease protein
MRRMANGLRRVARPALGGAAKMLLLVMLAGCGTMLDGDQARICRLTLPAVNPDATRIVVTRVVEASAPYDLEVDYRVTQDGRETPRYVLCGFGGRWVVRNKGALQQFATEEGAYSPLRVHILNRYWLDRPEFSTLADPGPGEAATPPLLVPLPAAYLLQSIANALPSTAMTMMIAVAYALVYGLVGRINLAFGELAVIGGYGTVIGATMVSALGLQSLGIGLAISAAFGVGLAILHGRVVERIVFTPLAFGPGQSVLVATLALAIVLQEYLRLVQGPQQRWMPPLLSTAIPIAGSGGFVASVTIMQLLVAGLAGLLAIALVLVVRWSEFGRRWRAVADDAKMAGLMGISSQAVLAETFLLATMLAGTGGFIMSVYYGGAGFAAGTMVGLKALVAAVVGGIGSIGGALVGGLAVGLFEAFWSAYLPIEHRDLAVLLLLVVVFVLRPGGLFGYAEATPRQV